MMRSQKNMILKIVCLACVLEITSAGKLRFQNAPNYDSFEPQDYSAPTNYKFSYGVEDYKTGDIKSHKEEREGDVVKGEYTVLDPDGTTRTVTYTADKYNGFRAQVKTTGTRRQVEASHPNFKNPTPITNPYGSNADYSSTIKLAFGTKATYNQQHIK